MRTGLFPVVNPLLRRPPAKRPLLYHKLVFELSRNPLILEADISGQAVLVGRVVLAANQRGEITSTGRRDAEAVCRDVVARHHLLLVGDLGERDLADAPAVR